MKPDTRVKVLKFHTVGSHLIYLTTLIIIDKRQPLTSTLFGSQREVVSLESFLLSSLAEKIIF